MIRKSAKRFSGKIMRKKIGARQALPSETHFDFGTSE